MMMKLVAVFSVSSQMMTLASVSPEQVRLALGGGAGLPWTVAGPANGWSAAGGELRLASSASGAVYTLETTASGPGILGLRSYFNGQRFNATITIDGEQTGLPLPAHSWANRVHVPAGEHVIRWVMVRKPVVPGEPAATTGFANATWEPFVPAALQGASSDETVTLSGDWIGQETDGGVVAWSGLNLIDPVTGMAPEPTLRAEFSGPCVLSYQIKASHRERLRIDGGPWAAESVGSTGWILRRRYFGPGSHVVEWRPDEPFQNVRAATDLWIKEISLLPSIDLAEALDTPGWAWEAPVSGGHQAYGIHDPTAAGGASVVLVGNGGLRVTLPDERILKVRYRGQRPAMMSENKYMDFISDEVAPEDEGTEWRTLTVSMNDGGIVRIRSWNEAVIDRVTVVEPEVTLEEALGLPAGAVVTGGGSAWKLAPVPGQARYGAKTTLTKEVGDAWLEFEIEGPAKVEIDPRRNGGWVDLKILADGDEVWSVAADGGDGGTIGVEFPEGIHRLRLLATLPTPDHGNGDRTVSIDAVRVRALDEPEISAALGVARVWGAMGGWTAGAGPEGEELALLPEAAETAGIRLLKANFEGPGRLTFRTWLGGASTRWSWGSGAGTSGERSFSDGAGWRETSLWLPPGRHWVKWRVVVQAGGLRAAMDDVAFSPSEVIPLGLALGAPHQEWVNDPDSPWTGVIKSEIERCAVSEMGGPSKIGLVLPEAGDLSFRWRRGGWQSVTAVLKVDGVELWRSQHGEEGAETLRLPSGRGQRVEWSVSPHDDRSWFELSEMDWTPLEVVPLAEALDAGEAVEWSTSAEAPFSGLPDAAAVDGSSAQVGLAPGEETWLEALVDGSGLFDFWFRDVPGAQDPATDISWELWIDGVKAAIPPHRMTWPAQWVLGDGPHRIRLKFRNDAETGGRKFIAVDQVSWVPLPVVSPDPEWAVSGPDAAHFLTAGGRDGGAVVVLPSGSGEERWIERTFQGPGVVEWDSRADYDYYPQASLTVVIDASCHLRISQGHEWTKNRLSLPAGEHTVRWRCVPDLEENEPVRVHFDSIWRISGVKFTPGLPEIMAGVDHEQLIWLATGDEDGELIEGSGFNQSDAWSVAAENEIFICNPGPRGLRVSGKVFQNWHPHGEGQPEWRETQTWAGPGEVVFWQSTRAFGFAGSQLPCLLDDVRVTRLEVVDFAKAVELTGGVHIEGGWIGISSQDEAHDGIDSGWSQVRSAYPVSVARLALDEAARVKFQWRRTGTGSFGIRVNGGWLPVPEPLEDWQEVEFEVAGPGKVEWVHEAGYDTSPETPGDAWLDAVTVTPVGARTLGEVAAAGTGLHFQQSVETAVEIGWSGVGFRDAEGVWREAARGVTGAAGLTSHVTGPTVVKFRVRCDGANIPPAAAAEWPAANSVIIVNPGPRVTARWLRVRVGDSEVLRVEEASGEWLEREFYVPQGEHEVSWQLSADWTYGFGNGLPEWQAWVGNVSLTSPLAHYQAWATSVLGGLDEDPEGDPDGDGATNLWEYAYGTNPADSDSHPSPVSGNLGTSWGGHIFRLRVPRLPAHVRGVLEVSEDLEAWAPSPRKLRSTTRPPSPFLFLLDPSDRDEGIDQVLEFPVGVRPEFYRVKLELPAE